MQELWHRRANAREDPGRARRPWSVASGAHGMRWMRARGTTTARVDGAACRRLCTEYMAATPPLAQCTPARRVRRGTRPLAAPDALVVQRACVWPCFPVPTWRRLCNATSARRGRQPRPFGLTGPQRPRAQSTHSAAAHWQQTSSRHAALQASAATAARPSPQSFCRPPAASTRRPRNPRILSLSLSARPPAEAPWIRLSRSLWALLCSLSRKPSRRARVPSAGGPRPPSTPTATAGASPPAAQSMRCRPDPTRARARAGAGERPRPRPLAAIARTHARPPLPPGPPALRGWRAGGRRVTGPAGGTGTGGRGAGVCGDEGR